MAIWLMSVFVREVPLELEEAARHRWRVTAVAAVESGAAADRAGPRGHRHPDLRVLLERIRGRADSTMKQTATVPVAIAKFAQDFEIQYTQMAASAALSICRP